MNTGKETVLLKKKGLLDMLPVFKGGAPPLRPSLNYRGDQLAVTSGKKINIYNFKY